MIEHSCQECCNSIADSTETRAIPAEHAKYAETSRQVIGSKALFSLLRILRKFWFFQ